MLVTLRIVRTALNIATLISEDIFYSELIVSSIIFELPSPTVNQIIVFIAEAFFDDTISIEALSIGLARITVCVFNYLAEPARSRDL